MNGTSCDPKLEANRQAYLEYLYDRDGRHDPAHAMHSLYTGLAVRRESELAADELNRVFKLLGRSAMEAEIRDFHKEPGAAPYFEGLSHA